ncbi:competence stimulating peptide [Streptococcus troglodytae]|uniref:Competence stimulating peptide n=1 Tax=Streptococcus troglodytae TaxID=1111760 RepID=A0A1L7LH55_9STRE|nr:competence stimulating peptide [Streptococcus troglodytae]
MKETLPLKNDFKEIKTDELEISIGGSGSLPTFSDCLTEVLHKLWENKID